MPEQRTLRIASISTILGAGLLLSGTMLHPMTADPNNSSVAFQQCAASDTWLAIHLAQLAGMLLIICSLVALYGLIAHRSSRSVARLGMAGAIASAGVFAALQAVDGIALKRMVDAWVVAPAAEKTAVFHAAEAVRQIEIGLASLFGLLFGITVVVYGAAIVMSNLFPKWLGWVAVLAGIGLAVGGATMAHTGFSAPAMNIGLGSNLLLMVWLLMIGSLMWHRSGVI